MKLKSAGMGTAFNMRRLIMSEMETSGAVSQENLDELYTAYGASYTKHLEFETPVPPRYFEQMVTSIIPAFNEGEELGMLWRQDLGGKEEKGSWGPAFGNAKEGTNDMLDFSNPQLAIGMQSALSSDIQHGYMTPKGGLAMFTESDEEIAQINKLYKKTGSFATTVQKWRKREGFDFSRTRGGRLLGLSMMDKLLGVSRGSYKFSQGSGQYAGLPAFYNIRNKRIKIGGEEMTIGQAAQQPWVQSGLAMIQYLKRSQGNISFSQRASVEQHAINIQESGGTVGPMLTNMRRQLETGRAWGVAQLDQAQQIVAGGAIALEQYGFAASELPKVISTEEQPTKWAGKTTRNIIARNILGLSSKDARALEMDTEVFTRAGDEFERLTKIPGGRLDLANTMGMTNVWKPEGYTVPQFGSIVGDRAMQEDIVGLYNMEGQDYLAVGDIKWKYSKEEADKFMNEPWHVGPQTAAYAHPYYVMSHPEEMLGDAWENGGLKEEYGTAKNFFVTNVLDRMAADSEKVWTEDERAAAQAKAESWYEAARQGRILQFTAVGTGGLSKSGAGDWVTNVAQMDWLNQESPFAFLPGNTAGDQLTYDPALGESIAARAQLAKVAMMEPGQMYEAVVSYGNELREKGKFGALDPRQQRIIESAETSGKLSPDFLTHAASFKVDQEMIQERKSRLSRMRAQKEQQQANAGYMGAPTPRGPINNPPPNTPTIPPNVPIVGGGGGVTGGGSRAGGGGPTFGGTEGGVGIEGDLTEFAWMNKEQVGKALNTRGQITAMHTANALRPWLDPMVEMMFNAFGGQSSGFNYQSPRLSFIGKDEGIVTRGLTEMSRFNFDPEAFRNLPQAVARKMSEALQANQIEGFPTYNKETGEWTDEFGSPVSEKTLMLEDLPRMMAKVQQMAPQAFEDTMAPLRAQAKMNAGSFIAMEKAVGAHQRLAKSGNAGDLDITGIGEVLDEDAMIAATYNIAGVPKGAKTVSAKDAAIGKTPESYQASIDLAEKLAGSFENLTDKVDKVAETHERLTKINEDLVGTSQELTKKQKEALAEYESSPLGKRMQKQEDYRQTLLTDARQALERSRDESLTTAERGEAARKFTKARGQLLAGEREAPEAQEMLDWIEGGARGKAPGQPSKFGKAMRGIFGGWGMMYLGRAARMATQIWQKSYGTAEAYEIAAQRAQQGYEGYDPSQLTQPLALAQEASRIRGGGGLYGTFARNLTAIDDMSGITGPLMGAVGGGMAGSFIAGQLGLETAAATGVGLGAGAIIGAGLLIGNAYQSVTPENIADTQTRAATQIAVGKPLSAATTSIGLVAKDMTSKRLWKYLTSPEGQNDFFMNRGQSWKKYLRGLPMENLWAVQEMSQQEQQVAENMTIGELKALYAKDPAQFARLATGMGSYDSGPWGTVSSASKNAVMWNLLSTTGRDDELVQDIAIPAAQTIDQQGPELATANALYGLKGTISTEGDIRAYAAELRTNYTDTERAVLNVGSQYMLQLPGIKQVTSEMTDAEREELAAQLGPLAQGPNADIYTQRFALARLFANKGVNVRLDVNDFQEPFGEKRRGREERYNTQLQRGWSIQQGWEGIGAPTYQASAAAWRAVQGQEEGLALGERQLSVGTMLVQSLGYTGGQAYEMTGDASLEELTAVTRQGNIENTLLQYGLGKDDRERFTGALGQFGMAGYELGESLLKFNPRSWSYVAKGLYGAGLTGTAAYSNAMTIARTADYDMVTGAPTGLGMYATSLRSPTGGLNTIDINAQAMYGEGWQNNPYMAATAWGVNRETGQVYNNQVQYRTARAAGADIATGAQAPGWVSLYANYNNAMASVGIGYAQIALQEKYQPMFWDIQDRMRALQNRQTEWGFARQEEQLAMQTQQWQANFDLGQRQSRLQRQWTQEDWGYNQQVRALQWGWKQEDFSENIRFTTGRERKLGERQMERETVMFNLESGQIDKQKERQKQLWAIEDERFKLQKKFQEENKQFQEENIKKQREFYEERKKLEEEQIKLQRQQWEEQIELQKASLGVQAQSIQNQFDQAQQQLRWQEQQQAAQGDLQVLLDSTTTVINNMIEGFPFVTEAFNLMIADMKHNMETGDSQVSYGDPYPGKQLSTGGRAGYSMGNKPGGQAEGGDQLPGQVYITGEDRWEVVRPTQIGSVVNQYDLLEASNMEDRWTTRSVFYPSGRGTTSGAQTINVYVGNEKLGSYVVSAVKSDIEVI